MELVKYLFKMVRVKCKDGKEFTDTVIDYEPKEELDIEDDAIMFDRDDHMLTIYESEIASIEVIEDTDDAQT